MSTVPAQRRIDLTLDEFWTLTQRSMRHGFRNLDGLFVSILLPVMLLLLFVYVFGGAIDTGTDYLNYVVPGIILLTAGYSASHTAIAVNQDMTSGMIDRFRSLPIGSASILSGHVIAGLLRNLLSTMVVIVVSVGIGFRPTGDVLAWIAALAIISLYILAIAWLSAMVGVFANTPDAANGFTLLFLFLPYISSAFVPPETLPGVLQPIAKHQPVTPLIETLRNLLNGQSMGSDGWIAIAWCIGIISMAVPAAAAIFRWRVRQ